MDPSAFNLIILVATSFASGAVASWMWYSRKVSRRPQTFTLEEQRAAESVREVGLSTFELKALVERLTKHVNDMSGTRSCAIYLSDGRSPGLTLIASSYAGEATAARHEDHELIQQVFQKGKSVVVTEGLEGQSVSHAGMPLRVEGRLIGAIHVQAHPGRGFTKSDLKLLEVIAEQAATAIEKVQAYHEVQRIAEKFSMIIEVGSAMGAKMDLEEVLQLIAKTAGEEMEAWACSLRLLDSKQEVLCLRASYGPGDMYLFKGDIAVGRSVVGRVSQTKQPMVIPNLKSDSRFDHPEIVERGDLHSLVCVPIVGKDDQFIGTLTVYHTEERAFTSQDVKLLSALSAQAAVAIENARLFGSLRKMYMSTIKAISAALSARDLYTGSHSDEASGFAKIIAEELGLDGRQRELVEYGAILHDIGKIGISDRILGKPQKLTEEEYEIMKQHPVIGAKILEPLEEFKDLAYIIAHHHEHFDGTGYPDGLHHEQIPLVARILHVVDAFHAMTSNRPYRKALPRTVAIEELKDRAGSQFDPQVVEALLRAVEKQRL